MEITVTPEAEQKIAEMCVENDFVGIRAFVSGGGCAGMQHGLGFLRNHRRKGYTSSTQFLH